MNIQKLKHSRTFMSVLQGLLLLAILSTLFSVCFNLMMTGFSDDIAALNEKLADQQIVIEGEAADGLEALNAATASLEKYKELVSSLKPLSIIMYTGFALLFLLKALITRDKWRLNLFRYGIGSLLFAVCAILFAFMNQGSAYGLAAFLHAAALITDHVFSIVKSHKVRNLIPRVLFILILLFIVFCAVFVGGSIALLYLLFLNVPRIFYYIAQISFSRIKLDALRKIVRKTYAAEILFGMIMLIVAFSIVLPQFETGIPTFEDALWYCFAIVTTIGFGDFTAVSLPGRLVSVLLGLYGIIVVALITSIIVNFYNETKDTADPADDESGELETAEE